MIVVVEVVVDRDREVIGTSALWGTSDRQAAPVHVLAACLVLRQLSPLELCILNGGSGEIGVGQFLFVVLVLYVSVINDDPLFSHMLIRKHEHILRVSSVHVWCHIYSCHIYS